MKLEDDSSAADRVPRFANSFKPNLCTVCLWLFSVEDHMIIYSLLNFVLYSGACSVNYLSCVDALAYLFLLPLSC